ncbi:hydrogenase maturation nickel metallochaperone HypA [Steroidobacter sp. S1-65]|uniref:Hydrogenase maturation factor HypA n=1 Tax=Steroidobacter gossypii TaxID=2805490 RepID=A0ABS1WVJ5_9GAMM|nr:hydrogenase maturation nickel metallochaperone HypA [Steroidobacter gossypii]MBM0104972.1 hydrogenase maturation nickel metallochaperone HypA [Steroidobacter gossypii]
MHELGISRNIVAIVAEAAAGRRVRRVTVEIGKLSGVLADAVAFCFEAAAHGTPLQGASLDIVEIEGRARCLSCGVEFNLPSWSTPCSCGSQRLVPLAGEELKIKAMEVDEVR